MRAQLHGITDSNFPQLLKLPTPNVSRNCDIHLDESLGKVVHNL